MSPGNVIPTRILVFAKAPVRGRVKTRLIPALGAPGAARLARRLLDHTLAQALAAGSGAVELCASPGFSAPDWAAYPLPPGVATSAQGDGDLGARLARAARRHLAQGACVLLIGTDCPSLSAVRLQAAAVALADHDAALYPALDGGYTLLGLRADHPSLFADIPWSTAQVAAVTRARMQALGWRVWVGEALADIDTPPDLLQLPEWLRQTLDQPSNGL
ncbi:MAG: TIGR04282 family arsenosugar biosynthesis glycosyltransferase [Phenylobacterium sp.]|jgi:rSAM/selenodomain-associated transferase 1|nr:TIGR04282 family arsenosugar biosynthesis glycosyltransferase [Phenylobacterium sp.]